MFWQVVFKNLYSDLHVADETTSEFALISFSSGQVATPLENGSENPSEIPSEECCSGPFSVVYLTIIPECLTDEEDVPEREGRTFPHVVPHQGTATDALFEKNLS